MERYIDYDTEGTVFGRPEQIEPRYRVIKDSITLLAEIKFSISREEIYAFQRKVEFYERKKGIKVTRKAVISPFVDPRARPIAERLNIEVYTSGYDVRI
ncbi:PD-(D/E)XK nuclease superfamily protein [Candidatus Methanoperedenaceae archaeon GB37]|nr:PD-(D/E)XK nuclease superfamily protein [Candidatus Methanoperedenaceae archaeon GB37]